MKRIHTRLLLATALLMVTMPLGAQDAAKPDDTEHGRDVALVTAVRGEPRLLGSQGETPLRIGARPTVGDEVIAAGGSVSLVFLTGDLITIRDGERLMLGASLRESTLNAGGTTRGLGQEDATTVSRSGMQTGRRGRVWQAQLASVSGIRGDGMPIAVAPRLAIATEYPRFYWFDTDTSGGAGARTYILVLKNEENAVIARQTVRGRAGRLNSFVFDPLPAGFEPAPRMHYHWTVLPEGAAVPDGQLDAGFVFVDRAGMDAAHARQQRLDAMRTAGQIDEATYHLLLAEIFLDERERLFSDGIPHLLALAETPYGEEYAGEQLARTFLRFGNQVSALAPMFHTHPGAYLGQ